MSRTDDGAAPRPDSETLARLPRDGGEEFNRLVFEHSPYLLQHARNPVDWRPWGDEAFADAQAGDKPVFLSIGYSTCHWCHVMERESFENETIARILKDDFIAIKVDREERPDVDAVYMKAVQMLAGSGGWPMSVFLLPDRRPFFGGTYFPPDDRYGRPGFGSLLRHVAQAWKTRRADIDADAERLSAALCARAQGATSRPAAAPPREGLDPGCDAAINGAGASPLPGDLLLKALTLAEEHFDSLYGGFHQAPKFPQSPWLMALLRVHARSGEASALRMVEVTLDHIARGGIADHLGGGFHRYSTDREWLVPHFEKMLYDQALLATTYLEAQQATGHSRHGRQARAIFEYLLRDMTDEGGAFFSAEDADSEGEEGKFYVWTASELRELLGDENAALFGRAYGVSQDGNFHDEATGASSGANILHLPKALNAVAGELALPIEDLETRLAGMRRMLLRHREARIHPFKDDKVLTDWNGLMIAALALGGRVLGDARLGAAADRAADFLWTTMRAGGGLRHRFRHGDVAIAGFLEDYAFFTLGLVELSQTTLDARRIAQARELADEMLREFWDEGSAAFYLSAVSSQTPVLRPKELHGGAIPSGNGVAAYALVKLARLTGITRYQEFARATLAHFGAEMTAMPLISPYLLMAHDLLLDSGQDVVLVGERHAPDLRILHGALFESFRPRLVVARHHPGDTWPDAPWRNDMRTLDGKAAAYLCQGQHCQAPVTSREDLLALLTARG